MSRWMTRINGAKEFAKLSPEDQGTIGGLAIEHIAALIGDDAHEMDLGNPHGRVLARAFDSANTTTASVLEAAVELAIPSLSDDGRTNRPVPSVLGEVCGTCGCTQFDACYPGEKWARVATDEDEALCQACADKAGAADVG